jgi:hypothetical protein
MSSTSTGFNGRSVIPGVGDATGASSRFGHAAQLQLVRDVAGGSQAVLACAAAAMARVEQEIDHLWRESMNAEDLAMSQRLAEVSHALQRAARLLEPDDVIG